MVDVEEKENNVAVVVGLQMMLEEDCSNWNYSYSENSDCHSLFRMMFEARISMKERPDRNNSFEWNLDLVQIVLGEDVVGVIDCCFVDFVKKFQAIEKDLRTLTYY